jgi:sugar O-acyltransferase (sialic acid O-acetyltransferase NeuD family)
LQNILIIGAGGWGREVLVQLQGDPSHNVHWTIKGFLDSRNHILDGFDCGLSIIGDPSTYKPIQDDAFVCAQGLPKDRHKYSQPIIEKNGIFPPILTRSHISPRVRIGQGCFVAEHAQISPDVWLGDFSNVFSQSIIAHDVLIDEYAQIGAMTFIGGGARIGKFSIVHPHSTILPGVTIGENSVVGAGSVVTKDVLPGVSVFGNPARVIFSSPAYTI